MGRLKAFIAEVLGFEGWKIVDWFWVKADGVRYKPISRALVAPGTRLIVIVKRHWMGRCSECCHRCRTVHEHGVQPRVWHDLDWCDHPVDIEYAPDRLQCSHCGSTSVELLPWADRYQRETKRLQQHMAVDAQSMPTSHVAGRYNVDWHCVRRAERQALERWQATRSPDPLPMVGIDEKYLGRRNSFEDKYITIVSNLLTGEPIWIGFGRSEATVKRWLDTLSKQDKAEIRLFAMDMHESFKNAIRADPDLNHAEIAHDPFHIMKRAIQALEEVRREVFFRAGPKMRGLGRGQRWLFLRAWNRCTPEQQQALKLLLGCNRRLAHAYQVVEELRDVLHAPNDLAMTIGLLHVLQRTARRSDVPMRKLHDSLLAHMPEIVALARHNHPPTGHIEALNNNWETAVRQGRGYRHLQFLLLKVRFMTVNPIREENGVRRFLDLGLPTPYHKAA